jgi:hypothetical protein
LVEVGLTPRGSLTEAIRDEVSAALGCFKGGAGVFLPPAPLRRRRLRQPLGLRASLLLKLGFCAVLRRPRLLQPRHSRGIYLFAALHSALSLLVSGHAFLLHLHHPLHAPALAIVKLLLEGHLPVLLL